MDIYVYGNIRWSWLIAIPCQILFNNYVAIMVYPAWINIFLNKNLDPGHFSWNDPSPLLDFCYSRRCSICMSMLAFPGPCIKAKESAGCTKKVLHYFRACKTIYMCVWPHPQRDGEAAANSPQATALVSIRLPCLIAEQSSTWIYISYVLKHSFFRKGKQGILSSVAPVNFFSLMSV